MKILQVSHGLPPQSHAGVELYTFYLSKALVQQDHPVHVYCRVEDPTAEEFSASRESLDGLNVTRVVNNLTRISDPRVYYENGFFDRSFRQVLRDEKPDLVHFQHFIALSGRLPQIAKDEGFPVVMTLHDFFVLCHRIHLLNRQGRVCSGPLYGLECVSCLDVVPPTDWRTILFLGAKDRLPFPAVKWSKRFLIPSKHLRDKGYEAFHRYRYMFEMFKALDLVLTPSRFVRDLHLKYYPSLVRKLRVLPLGIPPIPGARRVEEPRGMMRFCYFGNILPIKGLHVLLDAFKGLPKGRAILTLYGERTPWNAAYYDQLREEASGHPVSFRGSFKREDLCEALKDQDVVVLPSICPESFSLVVREANRVGLPVVASSIGAIPEVVEDGRNGLLVEPGNVEAWKQCLLRLIDQPRLVTHMASRLPKAKDMADHAKELVDLYREVLEKR